MKAIVTGAGSGIGKAVSIKLCEMGYGLVLISRNKRKLEAVKKELLAVNSGVKIEVFSADLSTEEWLNDFQETFSDVTPDVIVNNVGTYMEDWASGIDMDKFQKLLQLNFKSAVTLTNSLLPKMLKKQKGHIFNICSVAALEPKLDAVSYSITKSALGVWGASLRMELKKDKINLTNIYPAAVGTHTWDGTGADTTKMIQAEDIAKAVAYSLSLSRNANCDEIHLSPQ